ncbi:MAG: hypothetical protein AB7F22_18110 [Reyranella sp.]|uniref:hypothetical protein n=1 Tax=Reyranella sp. TaxID=1929291 RepID=UPI003D126DA3
MADARWVMSTRFAVPQCVEQRLEGGVVLVRLLQLRAHQQGSLKMRQQPVERPSMRSRERSLGARALEAEDSDVGGDGKNGADHVEGAAAVRLAEVRIELAVGELLVGAEIGTDGRPHQRSSGALGPEIALVIVVGIELDRLVAQATHTEHVDRAAARALDQRQPAVAAERRRGCREPLGPQRGLKGGLVQG